ncbi:Uncharacterised protein [Citrobacter amalonaticus]|nr:Uncharacterised protein [Citrobacter amalonaticus]
MGRINKAISPFVGLKPLHHLRIDTMVLIVGLGPRSQLRCRDHGPSCGVVLILCSNVPFDPF